MGKYEKPSIDKKIAAKMFDDTKLKRMRCNEIRKIDKERNLIALKRTSLPVIEPDYVRVKDSKCNRCNKDKETYGLTFEWHLEPIDVLDDDKGFYGRKNSSTKRMLSRVTNGIVVQPAKIKMIKYLQENKSEIPIVYVLKSKDHKLDEILLNFCLENYELKTALSTAGISEASLENHLNSHKSLMLFIDDEFQLKNVLKCIEYGKLKEIYLMPVSINSEIQHSKEFKPPIVNILPKFFYENYGIVKVNFNEPYTCSDLLQWIKEQDKTEIAMIETVEGHLLHDISFRRPIFSTNILAYILLTYFRTNGGTIEEIAKRIDEIRNIATNFIDFSFDGDAVDVAKYAVTKLNNKIIINENLMIKPKEDSATLIELWDYAETLICHFALQSVIILTAEHYKRVDSYVDYNKMIQHAINLCEIIQLEVPLYKACSDLKEQLENAFDILSRKDLLTKPNVVTYTEDEKRARRIAEHFDDDYNDDNDEYDSLNASVVYAENEVTINTEMQTEINYLKDVILPIQETYMNVAFCLKRLIGDQIVDEKYFLNIAMNAMIDECFAENCKYWESCSMKWMKNALKLFELWGIISKVEDSGTVKYFIAHEHNSEEAIHELARHIEQFSDY